MIRMQRKQLYIDLIMLYNSCIISYFIINVYTANKWIYIYITGIDWYNLGSYQHDARKSGNVYL